MALLVGTSVALVAHALLAPRTELIAFCAPALIAAICATALRDYERGAHPSVAFGVGVGVILGVLHHDFHELPEKAYQAFAVTGATFPDSFKDHALQLWTVALIGFAGAPWTLACFMLEGGGADDYTKARRLFYSDRPLFERLMEKLTAAVSAYLRMQIEAGVDAVQIFDSLGGTLASDAFAAASGRWITEIVASLQSRVPVIVFSKGVNGNWSDLAATGAQVLGVDWTVRLSEVRARLPQNIGVQGNLDPLVLTTTPEIVAAETRRILSDMRGVTGHVFNLGHGLPPTASLENIAAMVDTIRTFA